MSRDPSSPAGIWDSCIGALVEPLDFCFWLSALLFATYTTGESGLCPSNLPGTGNGPWKYSILLGYLLYHIFASHYKNGGRLKGFGSSLGTVNWCAASLDKGAGVRI